MKKIIYISLFIILSRSITGAQEPICILPNSAQGIILENQYKPIQDIQLYKVEASALQSVNKVPGLVQKNLINQIYSSQSTIIQKINS